MQVNIKVDGLEQLRGDIDRMGKEVPKEIRFAINKWGKELRDKYKNHLLTVHANTGRSAKGIHWSPLSKTKNSGFINMIDSAFFLSEATPHYVSPYQHFRLKAWVKRKGIPEIQGKPVLFVHNYPFIGRIYLKHSPRLIEYLEKGVSRGVRKR